MSDDNDVPPGHTFDGEEAKTIQKEVNDLQNLWNAYVELTGNSSISVGLHPPPAFMAMYSVLLNINQPLGEIINAVEHTQEVYEALQVAMTRIVAFGDAMFSFGQWCVSQGVLHANAFQCKCGSVDDGELTALLKGGEGV